MYGRNSSSSNNNIFNRNSSTVQNNNSSSYNSYGNSGSNNTNPYNRNSNSYGNYGSNNSSYGNHSNTLRIGSYRLKHVPNQLSRNLEDIVPQWKPSGSGNETMIPSNITCRYQTIHLSPTQLRVQDYYLIRKNKLEPKHQRYVRDAIANGSFNPDLMNEHITCNLKEMPTFNEREPPIEVLKEFKRNFGSNQVSGQNQPGNGRTGNSNNNPYSSNNSSYGNSYGNNNNSYANNNNSSGNNIFASNSGNRNIFNNNSSNNNGSSYSSYNNYSNNTGSNNIFSNNNNNSSRYGSSNNNSSSSNIFSNNNNNSNSNNPFNRNNNTGNNSGGNNSYSSYNIFSNSNNNANNNNSSYNTRSSNNIFNGNTNNNNNSSSNNIFNRNSSNNSSNNIFSNNNNNNSNNNSGNPFNRNNNSSGNNIFNNNNGSSGNNSNGNNIFSNNRTGGNGNNIFSNNNSTGNNIFSSNNNNNGQSNNIFRNNSQNNGNYNNTGYNNGGMMMGNMNSNDMSNFFYNQSQLMATMMGVLANNSKSGTNPLISSGNPLIGTDSSKTISQRQAEQEKTLAILRQKERELNRKFFSRDERQQETVQPIIIQYINRPEENLPRHSYQERQNNMFMKKKSQNASNNNHVGSASMFSNRREQSQKNSGGSNKQANQQLVELIYQIRCCYKEEPNNYSIEKGKIMVKDVKAYLANTNQIKKSLRSLMNGLKPDFQLSLAYPEQIKANLFKVAGKLVQRKINLPEDYSYQPLLFAGFVVDGLQIHNKFGTITWEQPIDVSGIDFSNMGLRILEEGCQCIIQQLNKPCCLILKNIPQSIQKYDKEPEKALKKVNRFFEKINQKRGGLFKAVSVNYEFPTSWTIMIKQFPRVEDEQQDEGFEEGEGME